MSESTSSPKIAIVLGTRPEIIKMSPIIRECERLNVGFFILHTGQHYSYSMDRVFFQELELPLPKYDLDVGSGTHAEQTGKVLMGVEKILMDEAPDIVLVQGDTNSVLAGALASVKLHIKTGHVEAGLRSYDRGMPEEVNRVVADHVSDYLFAPTEIAKQNLLREGIDEKKIFVTGNTIVDAVNQNLEISKRKVDILDKLGLKQNSYFVITSHRAENVDSKERLSGIIKGLELIRKEFSMPIIFPIHPRSEKMIQEFNFSLEGVIVIKPLGFMEFLQLEANSRLVLTDSGGVQEECCILGVPCVTLRDNTERPETLVVRSNVLAGTNPQAILDATRKMMANEETWENPFGKGISGEIVMNVIVKN